MTAKKDLKRLVRARAQKTGESYAAALRHLRKQPPEAPLVPSLDVPSYPDLPTLRRVEKPDLGFALHIPEQWLEEPPNLRNSPWEAFRAFGPRQRLGGGRSGCIVFRNPPQPAADAYTIARNVQPVLERDGFTSFTLHDAAVADRPGARLDFARPLPDGGVWAVRHYFVVVAGIPFCVSFGTTGPIADAPLLDALIEHFELLGELADAPASEPRRGVRYTVEKPEYGFVLDLPPRWEERPPNTRVSAWEVARFVEPGDARHYCVVTRRPRPDATVRQIAEEHQESLRLSGFGDFTLAETTIAGQRSLRLDASLKDAGRVWVNRTYYVLVNGISFFLSLSSGSPDEDAPVFDAITAGFRLLPTVGAAP